MEADIKMQIEAIKNPSKVRVMDYGEVVLLVDGHKGPYIKKEMAMIDLSKVKCKRYMRQEKAYCLQIMNV